MDIDGILLTRQLLRQQFSSAKVPSAIGLWKIKLLSLIAGLIAGADKGFDLQILFQGLEENFNRKRSLSISDIVVSPNFRRLVNRMIWRFCSLSDTTTLRTLPNYIVSKKLLGFIFQLTCAYLFDACCKGILHQ
jgi:hypothetical protein